MTAGGKNVAPQNLELLIKQDPRIAEAVVFGDRRPYLVALLRLAPDAPADAGTQAIARANASLAPYEQIKRFSVLADGFAIENALITPTLKVKRNAVDARFATVIEARYRGEG